jgi:hypothetical protein
MKSVWFWLCIILGLMLLACGLLVPAHLRAVESGVIRAGECNGCSVLGRGKNLVIAGHVGAAELFVPAARTGQISGWDRFGDAVTNVIGITPTARFWGDDVHTEKIFGKSMPTDSFASFIVQTENRLPALEHLRGSSSSAVQELLHTRALPSLTLFTPSASSSGQVYDAAVAETGLLLDGNHLTTKLSDSILALALQANRGNGTQPLEEVLSDFVSLGERFNWDQLTTFVSAIPDTATLHQLADAARAAGEQLPVLFVAVQMTGEPQAVAAYLTKFPQTGMPDITEALGYGAGGVRTLVTSGLHLYQADWLRPIVTRDPFGAFYDFAAQGVLADPPMALALKWLMYLGAGFFFALALHFARPEVAPLELPLQVRGVHFFRELLFALGFLLVVLLVSEPFLAQEHQEGSDVLRLHLPMAGGISAGIAGLKSTVMNPTILLTLLLFFVLQALIYLACLVKLAEIRRQQVSPRIKLKLLENEDHLFDAGLYLGFVGTIISLILASVGLVKFSLMAAYSSTSFGIIFVVIFKIFHLRPARRQLLLEAELEAATQNEPPVTVP